jgi:hypothetical protein
LIFGLTLYDGKTRRLLHLVVQLKFRHVGRNRLKTHKNQSHETKQNEEGLEFACAAFILNKA